MPRGTRRAIGQAKSKRAQAHSKQRRPQSRLGEPNTRSQAQRHPLAASQHPVSPPPPPRSLRIPAQAPSCPLRPTSFSNSGCGTLTPPPSAGLALRRGSVGRPSSRLCAHSSRHKVSIFLSAPCLSASHVRMHNLELAPDLRQGSRAFLVTSRPDTTAHPISHPIVLRARPVRRSSAPPCLTPQYRSTEWPDEHGRDPSPDATPRLCLSGARSVPAASFHVSLP